MYMRYTLLIVIVSTLVGSQIGRPSIGHSESTAGQTHNVVNAYPKVDAFLGEELHENEQELAGKIAAVIKKGITREFHERKTEQGDKAIAVRDAHPKAHGCVKAKFSVEKNLNPNLAKGVLVPGRTYDAWIRFSNSHANPRRADRKGDGRGMAIKLLGVPGRKLLEAQSHAQTQDFIMISHPVFIIDDPSDYLSLVEAANSTTWLDKVLTPIQVPFILGFQGIGNAFQTTDLKIANPLQTRYWSMVPYQLGTGPDRQAIKFSARPFSDASCPVMQDTIPSDPDDDFLRQSLQNTLTNGHACMEFLVQPRIPSMSVENSKDEWNEADAPFFKVATIKIPKQVFDTSRQNAFCENLSFNPWHSLPDHRPLGGVNRLRKAIYPMISEARHKLNATPNKEPE